MFNYLNLQNISLLNGIFSKIGGIAIAILLLLLMITIHELGHYTMGKLLKFKINEFAVGFGKAIFSKTNKSGEKISLRIVPLGGYCAFDGEDVNSDSPTAFNNQAPWKRLIVLFGGVLFNFLSAIIFSIFLLMVLGGGVPKLGEINGPNSLILQKNDIILKVENTEPTFLNKGLSGLTENVKENEFVTLTIERIENGKKVVRKVQIQKYTYKEIYTGTPEANTITPENENTLRFGVKISENVKYGFGEALLKSVPYTGQMAWECIEILGKLFTGQYGLKDVGGPLTTINVIADASSKSMLMLLLLLPLISVNLAVFNLLPIPALDGARMVFVIIEWIRGKPINPDIEGKIHMVGLLALFGFVILIDILQLFVF